MLFLKLSFPKKFACQAAGYEVSVYTESCPGKRGETEEGGTELFSVVARQTEKQESLRGEGYMLLLVLGEI